MRTGPASLPIFRSTRRRIGILSTYPPKLCGLATFAAGLGDELRRSGNRVDIIRIDDGQGLGAIGRPVVGELVNGQPGSIEKTAEMLGRCDVAIIQHEYGIYGGTDGEEILELLAVLDAPAIVVLHTVPSRPTAHQRSVLEAVCDGADRVVVMTNAAKSRLIKSYRADPTKVVMIPHGAASPATDPANDTGELDPDKPQLLTWGLLGPGKGIEHVIDALAVLGDVRPKPRYTIAGVTHPKVFAAQGDDYRHALQQRSWAHGVAGSVTFDETARDLTELMTFAASASVVVLPYDSRDQVTSGVLVDAIAAGRPVIATAFPHAVEVLRSGAGVVVPHGNPVALADAIREVVSDRDVWGAMAAEARRIAPTFSWSAVADEYLRLSDELQQVGEPVAI